MNQNEDVKKRVDRFVNNYFKTPGNISKHYKEPLVYPKYMLTLEKYNDETHMIKKLEDGKSLKKKIGDIFEIYMDLPYILHEWINVYSKIHSLLHWADPNRTRQIIYTGAVLIVIG